MTLFRNDETHLKKAARGALCLFRLWTMLPNRRIEHASTPTSAPAKTTPSASPEIQKTLYNALPGKWRRTLQNFEKFFQPLRQSAGTSNCRLA